MLLYHYVCISLCCVYKTQRACFTERFTRFAESQNNIDYIAVDILCSLIFHLHLLSICTSMSDCVLIMLTIELVCLFPLKMFSFLSVTNRAVNIHEVSTCIFVCVLLKLVVQVWNETQGLPSTVCFR